MTWSRLFHPPIEPDGHQCDTAHYTGHGTASAGAVKYEFRAESRHDVRIDTTGGVNCTATAVARRSAAIAGNAGTYRSSENGPSKEIAPSSSSRSLDITGGWEVRRGSRLATAGEAFACRIAV